LVNNSCILGQQLLQNTNRKPRAGNQAHWSATATRSDRNSNEAASLAPFQKHSPGGSTIDKGRFELTSAGHIVLRRDTSFLL